MIILRFVTVANLKRLLPRSIAIIKVFMFNIFLMRIKLNFRNRKPWLSIGLKTAIKRKNKLYVQSIKLPKMYNIFKYKEYKKVLSKLLKQSEREYIMTQLKTI